MHSLLSCNMLARGLCSFTSIYHISNYGQFYLINFTSTTLFSEGYNIGIYELASLGQYIPYHMHNKKWVFFAWSYFRYLDGPIMMGGGGNNNVIMTWVIDCFIQLDREATGKITKFTSLFFCSQDNSCYTITST